MRYKLIEDKLYVHETDFKKEKLYGGYDFFIYNYMHIKYVPIDPEDKLTLWAEIDTIEPKDVRKKIKDHIISVIEDPNKED
jgi:hypothetical protein